MDDATIARRAEIVAAVYRSAALTETGIAIEVGLIGEAATPVRYEILLIDIADLVGAGLLVCFADEAEYALTERTITTMDAAAEAAARQLVESTAEVVP